MPLCAGLARRGPRPDPRLQRPRGDVLDLGALLDTAVPAGLQELLALTAFDEDGDGRADDLALAVDPDAAGPGAATVVAVLIDPVGLAAGAGPQDLVDSGNLVV